MKREYKTGQHVKYIDKFGNARDALVTIWWGAPSDPGPYNQNGGEPGCNLVFVSDDPQAEDTYGRQLAERETSVVHKSSQPAHGNCWCWPEEL